MKVISKIDTRILVKGGEYEVSTMFNSGNQWSEKIYLKGVSNYYKPSDFNCLNKKSLPKINYQAEKEKINEIRKGSLLECVGVFKSLFKNRIYVVESVFYSTTINTDVSIKFKGIDRVFKFSKNNFRVLSKSESRTTNINIINDNDNRVITSNGVNYSKIADTSEVLTSIFQSVCDKNRNNLSIEKWAVSKINNRLNIEDLENYKNMTLDEILKILNEK
jgi:hypothetical protein